jgi:hypothetical protein
VVFALTGIMAYVIPDIPTDVKIQIQRERLLAKEAKFDSHRVDLNRSASEGNQTPNRHPPLVPSSTAPQRHKLLIENATWEQT